MCRPWSKQLNWWDSISLFLIPCRWLASKRVSALIHVRNIYRQWFSHRDHRPWLLFQLSGKVTVHVVCVCVCVCVCVSGCVFATCVDFLFDIFIYLSSCLSFLPQLYVLMWPCGAAKADFCPQGHCCCTKSKALTDWYTKPQSRKV